MAPGTEDPTHSGCHLREAASTCPALAEGEYPTGARGLTRATAPLKQMMKTTQEPYACPAGPRATARRPSLQAKLYSEPNSGWRFFVGGNVSSFYETLLRVIASRQCPGHVLLETLASRRPLVISTFAPERHRITRATALERNRLVASLATGLFVPYIRDKSPLLEIVQSASPTPLE